MLHQRPITRKSQRADHVQPRENQGYEAFLRGNPGNHGTGLAVAGSRPNDLSVDYPPMAATSKSSTPCRIGPTPLKRPQLVGCYVASEPTSSKPFCTAQTTSSCLLENPNFRWIP